MSEEEIVEQDDVPEVEAVEAVAEATSEAVAEETVDVVDEVASQVPAELESTDKLLALVSHLGPFSGMGYFLAPLIIYFVKKDSRYVSHHAMQALVYQGATGILMTLLGLGGFILSFFTMGIAGVVVVPIMMLLAVVLSVFPLIAAYKAFNSEEYLYPGCGAWAQTLLKD